MNKGFRQIRILTITIIIYMLAALSWWSVLLLRYNRINYKLASILPDSDNAALLEEFEKQRSMIIGEGMVFALALVIGIYLIYRSYKKEVDVSRQQHNFLLSVTHEFKSPLSVIKLILQTLPHPNLSADKRSEMLEQGNEEVDRLEAMINNLLTTTKVDAAYKPNFETIRLSQFLDAEFKHLEGRYRQNIDFQLIDDPRIRIDRELFKLVINNIIDNAAKYTNTATDIRFVSKQKGDKAYISIIDNGPGIPDSEKQKVFEKFYRIENEETRKTQGTGLGLYLVKEILKLHEAEIRIKDNKPSGTEIEISLEAYE